MRQQYCGISSSRLQCALSCTIITVNTTVTSFNTISAWWCTSTYVITIFSHSPLSLPQTRFLNFRTCVSVIFQHITAYGTPHSHLHPRLHSSIDFCCVARKPIVSVVGVVITVIRAWIDRQSQDEHPTSKFRHLTCVYCSWYIEEIKVVFEGSWRLLIGIVFV